MLSVNMDLCLPRGPQAGNHWFKALGFNDKCNEHRSIFRTECLNLPFWSIILSIWKRSPWESVDTWRTMWDSTQRSEVERKNWFLKNSSIFRRTELWFSGVDNKLGVNQCVPPPFILCSYGYFNWMYATYFASYSLWQYNYTGGKISLFFKKRLYSLKCD